MNAPSRAITLRKEAETQWIESSHIEEMNIPVHCSACGWDGLLPDLLCDPDDPNPADNDFWCPRCQTKGWSFI